VKKPDSSEVFVDYTDTGIVNMKQIKSKQDLAINGARPAFEQALHVGRPNMGSRETFLKYANEIFDRRWFSNNGPCVQELEKKLADHLQVKHCIAMCNGTIALEIAIRALGLTGEVIVPSYTFIATAHALQWQQITPVFADINPQTHTLDPEAVRKMITPRTTGIIGVHLWGRPCDVDGLQQIADEHGLQLLFDAAHAFSCSHQGKMIGNFGRCEVFSFHATKFFNTFEGGMVATNDDELAKQIRLMQNFGFSGVDNVIYPGTNGKMNELSAAMGLTGLQSIDQFMLSNQKNYQHYQDGIADIDGLQLIEYKPQEKNNYQYIVMEVSDSFPMSRDQLVEVLRAENILARKYFWPGCHNMEPYRSLYPHAGLMLPKTQQLADRVIVLPTGTAMTPSSLNVVLNIFDTLKKT